MDSGSTDCMLKDKVTITIGEVWPSNRSRNRKHRECGYAGQRQETADRGKQAVLRIGVQVRPVFGASLGRHRYGDGEFIGAN